MQATSSSDKQTARSGDKKNPRVCITAFVDPEQRSALELLAQRNERSLSGELRIALGAYLERKNARRLTAAVR